MCEHEVKAAHPLYACHGIDKQMLFTRRFGVFAELLPERHLRRQGAENVSSESSGLALSPRDLKRNWTTQPKSCPA